MSLTTKINYQKMNLWQVSAVVDGADTHPGAPGTVRFVSALCREALK